MTGDLTKNLSRFEFACRCESNQCVRTPVDYALVGAIQDCIDHFTHIEKSLMFQRVVCHINSGYRCIEHNDAVTDGKGSGIHTTGMAADIWMEYIFGDKSRRRIPDESIAGYFEHRYPNEYGIGRYPRDDNTGRTHIDVRNDGPARWAA